MSKSPYTLTANDPIDRRMGTWLCEYLGVDPNDVAEVRHVYDFTRNVHLFEFIGWQYGPSPEVPWGFEVNAPLPEFKLARSLLCTHYMTDEALVAVPFPHVV